MSKENKNLENNLFKEKLDFLNPEQREAVESLDGPVMVVAGPGTGKTQILTLRIANILKREGADFAKNILALTFTDAGVKAMRNRLVDFVGPDGAYEVSIYTFHSFCADQIKKYPEHFKKISYAQPVSDVEQIRIIDEILEKGSYKVLKNFYDDYLFTKKILGAISDLKAEAISPEKFEESLKNLKERFLDSLGNEAFYQKKYKEFKAGDLKPKYQEKAEKELEKQKELLNIYQKYQEALKKKRFFDFNDMILRVVEEAENNLDFLAELQEQFLYILVDEHQDTNEAQNKLIDLITSSEVNERRPNLFVVGDKKQAIFKFQGASIEEFEKIKNKYKDVKVINLKNNYRSSQNILDTSYSLISEDEKLEAKNPEFSEGEEKIKVAVLNDRKSEMIFLAEKIQEKIESGINPNEIAVFFRNNNEVKDISDILAKYKIPYKLFVNENIFEDKEIKKFIFLLEAVKNPYDDKILGEVLFIDFLNLNPLASVQILNRLAVRKKGLEIEKKSVYKIISSREILESLDIEKEEVEKLLNFAELLKMLKREEKNLDFLEFLNLFVNETGFLKHILKQKNNILALARFEKIFSKIKEQESSKADYNLDNFLNYIETVQRHNLAVTIGGNELKDGVNLMTAHKSKGLEFEYVFITNLVQDKWAGKRRGGLNFFLPTSKVQLDIDDERRLFYVALTRGKKEVVISCPRLKEGNNKENEISVFLREIDEDFLDFSEIEEKNFAKKISLYFQKKEERGESIFDKEYIKNLFLKKTLSVSALNNYKKHPILYFFRNLIQLPSGQAKPMLLGSIIHDVLEQFFKEKGKNDILKLFEDSLKKFVIPEKYFDSIYNEGREILEKYYQKYKDDFVFEDIYLEENFSRSFELEGGHILRLTGFVDKIEKKGDLLTVVDYKTGYNTKAKRKKSDEELKRQIVFYKLLIDGSKKIDGVVEKGILDFVVELKKEKDLVKQVELVSGEDVKELEREINNFAEDIISGEFLEREYDFEEFKKENKYDTKLWDLWEVLRKKE